MGVLATVVAASVATAGIGASLDLGPRSSFLMSNVLFLVAVAVTLGRWPRPANAAWSWLRSMGVGAIVSAALYGVLLVSMRGAKPAAGLDVLMAVLGAAAIEEIVFRRWLPDAMDDRGDSVIPSRNWCWSCVAAQVAFALSHESLRQAQPLTATVLSAARLLILGILLAVVVQRFGLPAGIAIHAALNVEAEVAGSAAFLAADAATLVVAAALSLVALANAARIHAPSPSTPFPGEI